MKALKFSPFSPLFSLSHAQVNRFSYFTWPTDAKNEKTTLGQPSAAIQKNREVNNGFPDFFLSGPVLRHQRPVKAIKQLLYIIVVGSYKTVLAAIVPDKRQSHNNCYSFISCHISGPVWVPLHTHTITRVHDVCTLPTSIPLFLSWTKAAKRLSKANSKPVITYCGSGSTKVLNFNDFGIALDNMWRAESTLQWEYCKF